MLFVFPPELPVTGNNMNYCIVAFAIIIVISTIQWFVDGRKNFKGPHIDEAALKNAEVLGMPVDDHMPRGSDSGILGDKLGNKTV